MIEFKSGKTNKDGLYVQSIDGKRGYFTRSVIRTHCFMETITPEMQMKNEY